MSWPRRAPDLGPEWGVTAEARSSLARARAARHRGAGSTHSRAARPRSVILNLVSSTVRWSTKTRSVVTTTSPESTSPAIVAERKPCVLRSDAGSRSRTLPIAQGRRAAQRDSPACRDHAPRLPSASDNESYRSAKAVTCWPTSSHLPSCLTKNRVKRLGVSETAPLYSKTVWLIPVSTAASP
jgi:hypothetical protein